MRGGRQGGRQSSEHVSQFSDTSRVSFQRQFRVCYTGDICEYVSIQFESVECLKVPCDQQLYLYGWLDLELRVNLIKLEL